MYVQYLPVQSHFSSLPLVWSEKKEEKELGRRREGKIGMTESVSEPVEACTGSGWREGRRHLGALHRTDWARSQRPSFPGQFWRMSWHNQKGRSCNVLLPAVTSSEMPASRSTDSPALLLPGTRSVVAAGFPRPLQRMAKSANSEGHCQGRL